MNKPLLSVNELSISYRTRGRENVLPALRRATFDVERGETVGIVGESGSGKSTLGNAILGLIPVQKGTVELNGEDITHVSKNRRRELSRHIQGVFQDPYSSLNPTRTIGQSVAEGLTGIPGLGKSDITDRVEMMLDQVGLSPKMRVQYPLELSGGQLQRVSIARAVIGSPEIVICDEVTSALDLSVKAQIINLLEKLQATYSLSLIFIGHDLPVVRLVSNRILVMYKGLVMEEGDADQIYHNPLHPYSLALIAASPVPDPGIQAKRRNDIISVRDPSRTTGSAAPATPLPDGDGCPFAPRCSYVIPDCMTELPRLNSISATHKVACIRVEEIRAKLSNLGVVGSQLGYHSEP